MPQTKENPETGLIVLLGAAAVAAYGIYAGWFSSLFGTTPAVVAATPQTPPATSTGNPIAAGAATVNAPSTPPPLGTVVNTAADMSAQLAANYAYVIPAANMISTLGALAAQAGYTNVTTSDMGTVYLRPNVGAAATAALPSDVPWQLSQIVTIMKNTGLSGLGMYARGWR